MKGIEFTTSPENIEENALQGFFVGWQNHPTPATQLELFKNSDHVLLAVDIETKKVVGFITAITDKVLSAYIPFLEVLPEYQKQGIGQELTIRMLNMLKDYYMIDLLCDTELQPFYEKLGMKRASGMMQRSYDKQGGI